MNSSIIYTGGTFDLFHRGHVAFLAQCKRIAGEEGQVIVSLNTDEFVEKYKGKPPVYTFQERWDLLASCIYVDQVIKNWGGRNSWAVIRDLRPKVDFIVIGSDWASKDYYAQMGFTQRDLDLNNIGLIYVPYTPGISTTELKQRIMNED